MTYYKTNNRLVIEQVNQAFNHKKTKINEMHQLAKTHGFDGIAFNDHKETGLWLNGFMTLDISNLDMNKWKLLSHINSQNVRQFTIQPKKTNRSFYRSIRPEYENLTKTCFDYEPHLKLLGGVNWLWIDKVYYNDTTLVFESNRELGQSKPSHITQIASDEYYGLIPTLKDAMQ